MNESRSGRHYLSTLIAYGDETTQTRKQPDELEDLFEWEGVSLWKEDNNNNIIVSNDAIVGEKVVAEGPNERPNATLPEIVDDEIVGDEIVDDDVPKERVKKNNIPRVKIIGKRRLYQLFDED
ncbi:hypothetical protein Tco_0264770 [Tanacetum coccineum]